MGEGDGSGLPGGAATQGAPRIDRPGAMTSAEVEAWDALRGRVVVSLRPLGAATALGFLGLAAATWTLAGLQLGWMSVQQGHTVALVALGFAFGAQLIASVFSFVSRDGGAGTAMGELALIWLVVGLVVWTSPPGATSNALGLFLLFAGASLLLTSGVTALGKLVPALVFAVAGLRFLSAGIYELSAHELWENLSGVLGLVLAALAMYAAFASQLHETLGKEALPFGRRGRAKIAVQGSLMEQLREAPNAPGVRMQL